jgi:hypothetical protein
MTYNTGLFLVILGSSGLGYHLFNDGKPPRSDADCCESTV